MQGSRAGAELGGSTGGMEQPKGGSHELSVSRRASWRLWITHSSAQLSPRREEFRSSTLTILLGILLTHGPEPS